MVSVDSSVTMGLRCPSWREVHPSCDGQWHNPRGGDASHLALWNDYKSCVLPQRGEMHLQVGVHACVVLKQKALLNPALISLFQ